MSHGFFTLLLSAYWWLQVLSVVSLHLERSESQKALWSQFAASSSLALLQHFSSLHSSQFRKKKCVTALSYRISKTKSARSKRPSFRCNVLTYSWFRWTLAETRKSRIDATSPSSTNSEHSPLLWWPRLRSTPPALTSTLNKSHADSKSVSFQTLSSLAAFTLRC